MKKRRFYFSSVLVFVSRTFVSAAPPPEPPRPSSASSPVNEPTTNPPSNALVHLMSQFRMDKAAEPMPISLKTLEKMSITDTQHLLAENGLEKYILEDK